MNKRKDRVETEAYADMLARMIRGYGRRLADGDPADLGRAMALQDQLAAIVAQGVVDARTTHGWSWAEVGEAAGISRQAAHKRYGQVAA